MDCGAVPRDGESLDLLKQKGLASTMGPDHFWEE